jgi:hypothetical protein
VLAQAGAPPVIRWKAYCQIPALATLPLASRADHVSAWEAAAPDRIGNKLRPFDRLKVCRPAGKWLKARGLRLCSGIARPKNKSRDRALGGGEGTRVAAPATIKGKRKPQ